MLRKEIDFSKQRQEQALKERGEFEERAASIQESQGTTGVQATELQKEIGALQDALNVKQEEYKATAERVAQADAGLDGMRAKALEALNTRNKTETELETIGVNLSNVDTQLEAIYGRQDNQNTRHESLSQDLQQAQKSHTEKQRELTTTVEARQAAQGQRTELSEKMQKLNEEWQNLREKKSSQEARLVSLRELRDSYEGFATGVRAIMMAKQKNYAEVQGIIGPVGDLLSTDKEYERADRGGVGR